MKKFFFLLALLLCWSYCAQATDVTISATAIPFASFSGLGNNVTGTAIATTSSTTVTSSAAFPSRLVGYGGFQIVLDGVSYYVDQVSSTSSLTLTTGYVGSGGSKSFTIYPVIALRLYADTSFTPKDATYIVQKGNASTTSQFFKTVLCSVMQNQVFLPPLVLPATSDIVNPAEQGARWGAYFFTLEGAKIRAYEPFDSFILAASPTTQSWVDISRYQSGISRAVLDTNTLTRSQIYDLVQFRGTINGTYRRLGLIGSTGATVENSALYQDSVGNVAAENHFAVGGNIAAGGTLDVTGAMNGSSATFSGNLIGAIPEAAIASFPTCNAANVRRSYKATDGNRDVYDCVFHSTLAVYQWRSRNGGVYNAKDFGAVCNGVVDDTTALQTWANNATSGSTGIGTARLVLPPGVCKITSPIVYVGGSSTGIYLTGAQGQGRGGNEGSNIKYAGAAGRPALTFVGMNGSTVRDITIDGGGLANKGIVNTSTNPFNATTTTTASLTASVLAQAVTVTSSVGIVVGDYLNIDSGSPSIETVQVTAVASGQFSAVFTKNHSSGVTVTGLRLLTTSSITASASPQIVSTNVGANLSVGTLLNVDTGTSVEVVEVTGLPDSTHITAIFSKNHASGVRMGGSQGSSGVVFENIIIGGVTGTNSAAFYSGNVTGATTMQVDTVTFKNCYASYSVAYGTLYYGIKVQGGGNVKNYRIEGGGIIGARYAYDTSGAAGTVIYILPNTGQSQVNDFLVSGGASNTIIGAETESDNVIYVSGTVGSNPGSLTLIGCSFENSLPADKVAINWDGALVLQGNRILNNQNSDVPLIKAGGQVFGATTSPSTVVSEGNFYDHATKLSDVFRDGSGNAVGDPKTTGTYAYTRGFSISSRGDYGGDYGSLIRFQNIENGNLIARFDTLIHAASVAPATLGTLRFGKEATGYLRNTANDGDELLFSMNNLNIITFGGTGVKLGGATTPSAVLTTNSSGVVTSTTTPALGAATATSMAIGSGTVITKMVVFTPSLTPSSVSANTSAEQDFTVSGLTTADKVIVNGPAPTAGTGIVNVRVKATDTLSITFGNFTSGGLTPTAGSYSVIAIRN